MAPRKATQPAKKKTARKAAKKKAAEPTDKSLEPWIWDAACSIRGDQDTPNYKDYILPLIFTKRLRPQQHSGHSKTSSAVSLTN